MEQNEDKTFLVVHTVVYKVHASDAREAEGLVGQCLEHGFYDSVVITNEATTTLEIERNGRPTQWQTK